MAKQEITEEMGIHKQWFETANSITQETLPEFIRHLIEDYEHDYGTIVHAMVAGMLATARAIDHSDQGGITGFQASCIMWEFLEKWGLVEFPIRLLEINNMLYPQYKDAFTTIPQSVWENLQAKAKQGLFTDGDRVAENVKKHWESIVAGRVPFGYRVKEA